MSYSRRQLYAMGETFGDSATSREVGGRIIYGGGSSKAPAPQPTTTITESGPTVSTLNRTTTDEIPNYLTDASQDLIARGQALTSRPYEAYTGARVAEFSPDMQTAFGRMRNQGVAGQIGQATGLAGLAGERAMQVGSNLGTFNPYQAQAPAQYTAGTYNPYEMGGFTAEKAQQYMNPYMQNVVDIERRKAQEASDQQSAMLSGQAARQGAFGGSGAALQQRALRRDTAQQLGDIQAQGMGRAFEQGLGRFGAEEAMREQSRQYGANFGESSRQFGAQFGEASLQAERAREEASRQFGANYGLQGQQLGLEGLRTGLSASGQLAGLGQTQFGQEMDITKGLATSGDVQRQREQALMDVGYGDYLTAQKYPYEQLAFQQGLVSGVPYSKTQRVSGQEITQPGKQVTQRVDSPKEQPNTASQLIGAGTALYGAIGSGNAKGGLIHSYAAGGDVGGVVSLMNNVGSLSNAQLGQMQQGEQRPLTAAVVAEEILNRQKMQDNFAQQQALMNPAPQTTVAEEELAVAGLPGLPARNLENMDEVTAAGGGIVAFQNRGAVPIILPAGTPDEEVETIRMQNPDQTVMVEGQADLYRDTIRPFFTGYSDSARKLGRPDLIEGLGQRGTTAGVAPRATSLVPTTKPRKDLRKGTDDPRVGLGGLTPAKAQAEQAATKAAADKAAADKTVTNKGAAPNAGLSALRPPPTGMDDILTLARENANRQSTAEAEAAKIETDALAAKREEQAAAAEKAKTSYSDREERLKKREKGMEGAEERNLNSAFIEAGLAIMAGESSNALLNIAKGARQGLQGYEARLEKINANKEKLDDDFSRLYELREAKVTAEGDKLREIRQEEARLKAGGIRNLSAISSALGNTEIKVKETEFERSFKMWEAQQQRQTSLDVANINKSAAGRSSADKPFNYQSAYADYLKANAGKTDPLGKPLPVLSYTDYIRQFALPQMTGTGATNTLPQGATVLPRR